MMQAITIFHTELKHKLRDREMVVADWGYCGDEKVCKPYGALNRRHRKAMSKARVRHETINKRLKMWGCLKQTYRHDKSIHHTLFGAVITLTQIEFNFGYRPFDILTYRDDAICGLQFVVPRRQHHQHHDDDDSNHDH
jgi:hypothetical protein